MIWRERMRFPCALLITIATACGSRTSLLELELAPGASSEMADCAGAIKPSGAPVTLAVKQPDPAGIAVDSDFVYWANFYLGETSGLSAVRPQIVSVPIEGGAP
jgi:hypothetical protein